MKRMLSLLGALFLQGCADLLPVDRDAQNTVGEIEITGLPPVPPIDLSNSRAKAMENYRAFLKESPDSQEVPEAIRRLADLQLSVEAEALTEGRLAAGSRSRAAELYRELLQRFPDHEGNASALYQLARAYEQSGEIEPAMEVLSSYTREHPDGERYDEAQFRRGEYLFVHRRYREAEKAYLAVLKDGRKSEFYLQALYKLGWARFKQGAYPGALDAYVQLLDETVASLDSTTLPDTMSPAERERLDDTLRALSLSFSYLGGSGQIRDYFARKGARSYEPLLYARLAALYLGKERYSDAAAAYELFATSHPQHREAPLFRSRVIDVYKKAGFSAQVLAEKEKFIQLYEPASPYWAERDPAEYRELLQQVQRHLRDVAHHYHALAQQQKTPQAWAAAGRWYQLYLRSFPTSEQAPYMNFLYAELLTSAGHHGRAAAEYEHTAYDYGDHDKAAEAGYAALLAYQKQEARLHGRARQEWHRKGIDSAIRFADTFPEHREALAVRTRAAQQL
ncbi:MAG TPA: tetratricopeptide repeat protein, partial [Gammaproteobacteria bacterium]|nr:tetratricopeptide repeat protein [Gammaproteobacteria bacterium]